MARIHLGNDAHESYGLMVNCLYDLGSIETTHETFANRRPIANSDSVAALVHDGPSTGRQRSLIGPVDTARSRRGT